MEPAFARCYECNDILLDDGKIRQRHCARKCKECRVRHALVQRKEDPIRLLAHRFNNACRRHGVTDAKLWSSTTIRYVIARWGGKCVISGETDFNLLCIVSYWNMRDGDVKVDHLVLVTSHFALSISRALDRQAAFPESIRKIIEPDRQ